MSVDLSLGEVQSLCTKAARGAGRAVGVAEDAGRAVRWLCERGQDGAGALWALLQATDGKTLREMAFDLPSFTPARLAICPLTLGGYLSDSATLPEGLLGPVWSPVVLLPFVADLSPMGVDVVAEGPATNPMAIRLIQRAAPMDAPSCTRTDVSPQTLASLLDFAARTYAPATEESRARGAGAGLSDND